MSNGYHETTTATTHDALSEQTWFVSLQMDTIDDLVGLPSTVAQMFAQAQSRMVSAVSLGVMDTGS